MLVARWGFNTMEGGFATLRQAQDRPAGCTSTSKNVFTLLQLEMQLKLEGHREKCRAGAQRSREGILNTRMIGIGTA